MANVKAIAVLNRQFGNDLTCHPVFIQGNINLFLCPPDGHGCRSRVALKRILADLGALSATAASTFASLDTLPQSGVCVPVPRDAFHQDSTAGRR